MFPDLFTSEAVESTIARIEKLTPDQKPLWGKMNSAQMFAHCNIAYELVYEEGKHKKPSFLMRWILKTFIKKKVVGPALFGKNIPTAPYFLTNHLEKDFEVEKKRLINFLQKTQNLGKAYFEGKSSHSFGKLTAQQWNISFAKHLDHHLRQFGV